MTIPIQSLARDLVLAKLPNGLPKAFILRLLEPKAKRAEERMAKRRVIKSNPISAAKAKTRSEKSAALDKADNAFSLFIRLRDSHLQADGSRVGICCTCSRPAVVGGLAGFQCGHWQPRGNFGTRYDERNSHGQCYACNSKMHGNGKMPEHEKFIVEKYGIRVRDQLIFNAKVYTKRPSVPELLEIADKYTEKARIILQG